MHQTQMVQPNSHISHSAVFFSQPLGKFISPVALSHFSFSPFGMWTTELIIANPYRSCLCHCKIIFFLLFPMEIQRFIILTFFFVWLWDCCTSSDSICSWGLSCPGKTIQILLLQLCFFHSLPAEFLNMISSTSKSCGFVWLLSVICHSLCPPQIS